MSIYDKAYFVKKQGPGASIETAITAVATYPGNLLNADDLTVGTNDDVAKLVVINKLDWSCDYSDAIDIDTPVFVARVGQSLIVGVSCTTDVTAGKEVDAAGSMGAEGTTENKKIGKQYGGTDNPKAGISWIDLSA